MNDLAAGFAEAVSALGAGSPQGRRLRLPNEPMATASDVQATLTTRYLLPALTELEAFFIAVRALVDSELHITKPIKLGKPYPLGQCLEITQAVQQRLRRVDALPLTGKAVQGRSAFCAFLLSGGVLRQVWGDLRGEFFQNAFQLGTLYVDVSNDTVTPTKPKVEILPFAEARFVPIKDFKHFTRIAERYWKGHRVYPNHVLPELAPYCPLVHVSPQGLVQLRDTSGYMVAMATSGRFQPSEAVLRVPTIPAPVFDDIKHALASRKLKLAVSPEADRTHALRLCRDYRTKRWHQSQERTSKIILAVQQVNQHLAFYHYNATKKPNMPTITIDNHTYDLDTLSPDARAQLSSLQFVDAELARLHAQAAVLQTARMAYSKALQATLPVMPAGDTLKFN